LAPYSAVNPLLNHHATAPVTLRTLYGLKSKHAWSGIKATAFVFHQLYTKYKITKAEVQASIKKALNGRGSKPCGALTILESMVQVMAEVEAFLLLKSVNKCLTELAGTLSGDIALLNNTVVKDAVRRKIKSMLL